MIIKNLLYILQFSGYSPMHFLSFVYSHHRWWKLENRRGLDWTMKTRIIYIISWITCVCIIFSIFYFFSLIPAIISFIILVGLLPFVLLLALLLTTPIDTFAKNIITKKATHIIKHSNIKIIAITGSYGKTSAKEILFTVLKNHANVIKTPGNINTDIGVARFIIKNQKKIADADIFIVEMGADHIGDIAKLCAITPPDYSVLTGINEAHIESFGDIKNTIKEKFTLPQKTKKMSFLNGDDANIKSNYKKFDIENFVLLSKKNVTNIVPIKPFDGFQFNFDGHTFQTQLLAQHNIVPLIAAIKAGQRHHVAIDDIKESIASIKPFAHRLCPQHNESGDYWVIDDSYNANMSGVLSGLDVLQRSTGRRIVLTPGPLVEAGDEAERLHVEIGRLYATKADLVLLIQSPTTDFVVSGMAEKNFTNYKIYKTPNKAYTNYINVLRSNDTILLQNDFPDIYL